MKIETSKTAQEHGRTEAKTPKTSLKGRLDKKHGLDGLD